MIKIMIGSIQNQLNIAQDDKETTNQWLLRLIYSAAAQTALASLYDKSSSSYEQSISITHFKKSAENCIAALIESCSAQNFSSYPPIFTYQSESQLEKIIETLAKEILNVYFATGFCLYNPYHIIPCEPQYISLGPLSLIKGLDSLKVRAMSGLCLFNNNLLELKTFKDYLNLSSSLLTACDNYHKDHLANQDDHQQPTSQQSQSPSSGHGSVSVIEQGAGQSSELGLGLEQGQAQGHGQVQGQGLGLGQAPAPELELEHKLTFEEQINHLQGMFDLNMNLESFYEHYIAAHQGEFTLLNQNNSCQFLNLNYKLFTSYWLAKADHQANRQNLGLGRFTNTLPYLYFLYYFKDKQCYYSLIPKFLLENFNHPQVNRSNFKLFANAILHHHHQLKSIKVLSSNKLVYLNMQCSLPPAENNFLKLLSWPQVSDTNSIIDALKYKTVFKRTMSYEAFYCFYHALKSQGYHFEEQDK